MNKITLELRVIQILSTGSAAVSPHQMGEISRHVDSGVEGGLGGLLLFGRWVDGGETRLARDLTGGTDLLAVGHGESAGLIGEETLKFKGSRP